MKKRTREMYFVFLLGFLSGFFSYVGSSSYSYSFVDEGCKYPDAYVNFSTIHIGPPLIIRNGTDWKLFYNITWDPVVLNGSTVDFDYKVNMQQAVPQRTVWSPSPFCDLPLSNAEDVTGPFFNHDWLFTFQSLFQVIPALDGTIVTYRNAYREFDTPDCYTATNDSDFCSKQAVKTCGAPHSLNLLSTTLFIGNGTVVPILEWYSPVQINMTEMLSTYTVEIKNTNGDTIQSRTVPHEENITRYTWEADQSGPYDEKIERNTQYVFQVTPYTISTSDITKVLAIGHLGRARKYEFWSNVTSTVNASFVTDEAQLIIKKEGPNLLINLLVILCILAVAILVFIFVAKRKGLFKKDVGEEVFYRMERAKTNIYTEALQKVDPALKPKEISHDKITLEEELGKGQFGIVYKGVVYGLAGELDYTEVAVKTTKDGAFDDVKEDLMEEMKLMIQLGSHPNIMTLLACCTQREPYYLITEFMQYGDLLNFLRRCRDKEYGEKDNIYNIEEMEQLGIAHQIAKGMAYVQDERYYHGDLAARNVLVGRGLTVKISDFGLADDIYSRGYKRREQEQKIPIKWCSIEAILNGICSSEGDVWSYGVVLYEIFTLGGTPYPGIAGRFLVAQLREGYRMEKPDGCPDDIYKIMLQCWEEEATNRPRFHDISGIIDAMLVERSDYLCFEMEEDDDPNEGSSRPLSVPNIYVRVPGDEQGNMEHFAPIIEEDNDIDLEELQKIIHSEIGGIVKDANDNDGTRMQSYE